MGSIWECKIGEALPRELRMGADGPMRVAVRNAYRELVGRDPAYLFSGWGGSLTPGEQAVVRLQKRPVIAARARALALIAHIAACAPNLRLGQIIGNATPVRFSNDPFYVRDEELVDGLIGLLEQVHPT